LYYLELIFEPLICQAPLQSQILQLDSTFALLDWTPGSDCTQSYVEYGPAGFVPGNDDQHGPGGTLLPAGCPPFLLNGLEPLSSYDFYIREACSDGSFTANTCATSGLTLCSPPPLTALENFDFEPVCAGSCTASCNLTGSWRNGKNDQMDWFAWNGPTPTANTGPNDDVSGGGKYVFLETTGPCPFNARAELYSNCIEVVAPPGSSCHFSFHYMMNGANINQLVLQLSDNYGASWQTLWSSTGNQGPIWHRQYIDLNNWHETIVQLRFVGFKGFSQLGDIALDNLAFFGPIDLGNQGYTYYADLDQDGFGDPNNSITTCSPTPPPGYVDNNLDCFDLSADINPNAQETPCDGIDFNCNGNDDEYLVPPPAVAPVLACDPADAVLTASLGYGGQIHWYADSLGTELLHVGNSFAPALPPASSNQGSTLVFYAGEQLFPGCSSVVFTPAILQVAPPPALFIPGQPTGVVCAGELLNLEQLIIQDLNNTGASLSFHTALPADSSTLVLSSQFPVMESGWLYVLANSPAGCTALDSIPLLVSSNPQVSINGSPSLCLGQAQILTAVDTGSGQPPYQYLWNTASQSPQIQVQGQGAAGNSILYHVTLTDSQGCQSTDTLQVSIVQSISQVQVAVGDVQNCQGNDGFLIITPLGGTPPYHYTWNGPQSGSQMEEPGAVTVSGLPQGVYGLTVTDSSPEACAFFIPAIFVNSPDVSLNLSQVSPVSCAGGSDGCIQIAVSGSSPNILWSTGDTGTQICGLESGTYSVTVSSGSCSSSLEQILVPEPEPLILSLVSLDDVTCHGDSSGRIEVLPGGGNGGYQFNWSHGASTALIEQIPSCSYSATLTDALGCSAQLDSLFIDQPAEPLGANFYIEPAPCFGSREGYIEVFPQGGTPPYAFQWSNGFNSPLLNLVEAGSYTLTLTDALGCEQVFELELPQPDELVLALVIQQDVSCPGLENGSLGIAVSGGIPGYSYSWSQGDTTAQIGNLAAGFYTLTVADANDCKAILTGISVGVADTLNFALSVQPATCFGSTDGQIQLSALQGMVPFSYSWSHGASGALADSLLYGSYTVSIQDALGCQAELSVEVPASQPLFTSISAFAPICAQGSNGQIFLTPFGGQGPYQFSWNSGQTTANISGLPAGNYQCQITDARGCVLLSETVSLSPPPPIQIELLSLDSIQCHGDTNGSILMQVSGGAPPYQYTWSNETTNPQLTQAGPGIYQLTVVDSVNCSALSESFTLLEPAPLLASVGTSTENIPCQVNNIDTLFASVSGGTAPYFVQWNTGSQEPWLAQPNPGEYWFEVIDFHGCTAGANKFKLKAPGPALQLSLLEPLQAATGCGGGNAPPPSVSVLVIGGEAPYQFNWSFGVSGITSSDTLSYPTLPAGVSGVTVTDSEGCVASLSGIQALVVPELLLSTPPGSISAVACKGDSTGSISVQVQGGQMPYFYFWANASGDTVGYSNPLSGLPAGSYQVTVLDQLGCSVVRTNLLVNEPATSLQISAQASGNICHGGLSGTLSSSATGSITPYQFAWSNGSNQPNQTGVAAGWYSLSVTDFNNCLLSIDSISVQNVRCHGGNNGRIQLFITGGVAPYSYFWSNNTVGSSISNLTPNTYSCFITDALGCPLFSPVFTIAQPAPLSGSTYSEPSSEDEDGSAWVQAEGGTAPYTYLWSTGATDSLISPVGPGVYQVTITDSNSCSFVTSVEVFFDPLISTFHLPEQDTWKLFPNPGRDVFWLKGPASNEPLQLRVMDAFGRVLLQAELPAAQNGQYSFRLDQFPPGTYQLLLGNAQFGRQRIPVVLVR
jgi:hypothetical protein